MAKKNTRKAAKKLISLLLVEGETDEIFYKQIKKIFLSNCRVVIQRNLGGLYNVNRKIIERITSFIQQHPDEIIRVYCCLDRESRHGDTPGFDINIIKKYIKDEKIKTVLSIDLIQATQQIESWFLYDIEGIYSFLAVPTAERNPNAFKPPERYSYKDLQRLFERYGKTYNKGKRAGHFIEKLNIKKINTNCEELRKGIELIKSQSGDATNNLFQKSSHHKTLSSN